MLQTAHRTALDNPKCIHDSSTLSNDSLSPNPSKANLLQLIKKQVEWPTLMLGPAKAFHSQAQTWLC